MGFMKDKLLSNQDLSHMVKYAKEKDLQCWVAGGAITSIATGKHDQIEDYDIYFKDKYTCAEMIRYMKDINPHVSFVSDKSITYVMKDGMKFQFIFYDFYNTSKEIFNHFDFNCCMGSFNFLTEDFEYNDLFWLHNSQKFLGINGDTRFPILTMLRLDKYKGKGYKTSRNEILKLGLKISELNIDSWEKFKEHIGNSYGFTLADLKDCENETFSIEKAIEKLLSPSEEVVAFQDQYLYHHDVVDFIVLNEPLKYVELNGTEYYTDPEAGDKSDYLNHLVDKGILRKEEVPKEDVLNKTYYALLEEDKVVLEEYVSASYGYIHLFTKDNIPNWSVNRNKVIVKVQTPDEKDIENFSGNICVEKCKPLEIVCRFFDASKFEKGEDVTYRPAANMINNAGSHSADNWAFKENSLFLQGKIAQVKEDKLDKLKECVIMEKSSGYAHTKFSGQVLEGGEDLTPYEILLYADDFNLCFGGSITLERNGSFSGRYNTD